MNGAVVLDISSNGIDEILVFCKHDSKTKCLRVRDVEWSKVYLRVPDKNIDLDAMLTYVRNNCHPNINTCNRTDCCTKIEPPRLQREVDEEEEEWRPEGDVPARPDAMAFMNSNPCCKKMIKEDVVLNACITTINRSKQKRRSYIGAFNRDGDVFVEFTIARAYYASSLTNCLRKWTELMNWHDCEVHDVYSNMVESFMESSRQLSPSNKNICARMTFNVKRVYLPEERIGFKVDEVCCSFNDMELCDEAGELNQVKMTFDIETEVRPDEFTNPVVDRVLSIATRIHGQNYLFTHGKAISKPLIVEETNVRTYFSVSEKAMLVSFILHIKDTDPDVISGHNSNVFDWFFIANRCKVIGLYDFFICNISRVKNYPCIFMLSTREKGSVMSDKAFFDVPGRIFFDTMLFVMDNHRLPSNSLKAVCKKFLPNGKEKQEFSIKESMSYFNGTEEQRMEFFSYNVVDVIRTDEVEDTLFAFDAYSIQAFVYGTLVPHMFTMGMQFKVGFFMRQFCAKNGVHVPKHVWREENHARMPVIPYLEQHAPSYVDHITRDVIGEKQEDGTYKAPTNKNYEGATVLATVVGLFLVAVCFDFNSLYPSIIITENLCGSTFVEEVVAGKEYGHEFSVVNGYVFRADHDGIMKQACSYLINERAVYKKMAKSHDDPKRRRMAALMEKALKICNNSIYGGNGTMFSAFFTWIVALCITATGRMLLQRAMKFFAAIEGLQIISGDTDSVMVALHKFDKYDLKDVTQLKEVIEYAKSLEQAVNSAGLFKKGLFMGLEDGVRIQMNMQKKKYSMIEHKIEVKKDGTQEVKQEMVSKGTMAVRNDTCPFVKNMMYDLHKYILNGGKEVEKEIRKYVYRLLRGDVSMADVTFSQKVTRWEYDGGKKPPHMAAAALNKIDRISLGDFSSYAFARTHSAKKEPSKMAVPIYMFQNDVKAVDLDFIFTNKVRNQLIYLMHVIGFERQTIVDVTMASTATIDATYLEQGNVMAIPSVAIEKTHKMVDKIIEDGEDKEEEEEEEEKPMDDFVKVVGMKRAKITIQPNDPPTNFTAIQSKIDRFFSKKNKQ